eukprot:TRINITY_DN28463_c0_g1_i1.p1 TRINITY_DN28463_c0_g1~~TRINITY_DN28463_c0_g1_i1.p1  ORF type:complete len:153 (-),score=35.31 TRINITY_DN28463_c0_g1_i1:24-482(-)
MQILKQFTQKQMLAVITKMRLHRMEEHAIELAVSYVAANQSIERLNNRHKNDRLLPLLRVMKRYLGDTASLVQRHLVSRWHQRSSYVGTMDVIKKENAMLRVKVAFTRLRSELSVATRLWRVNRTKDQIRKEKFKQQAKDRLKLGSKSFFSK